MKCIYGVTTPKTIIWNIVKNGVSTVFKLMVKLSPHPIVLALPRKPIFPAMIGQQIMRRFYWERYVCCSIKSEQKSSGCLVGRRVRLYDCLAESRWSWHSLERWENMSKGASPRCSFKLVQNLEVHPKPWTKENSLVGDSKQPHFSAGPGIVMGKCSLVAALLRLPFGKLRISDFLGESTSSPKT